MPDLTGNIRDIAGASMVGKQVELIFTLNAPNVVRSGAWAGRVVPTEPVSVIPDGTGDFTVTLTDTTTLLNEGWYTLSIEWLRPGTPEKPGFGPIDFPDWRILMPSSGGTIQDLITDSQGRPGGSNGAFIWVGLTAPINPRPFTYWIQSNPDDATALNNTGDIKQWRP